MYKNYIFDLYGTLVDIHTDESNEELWYKLSVFFNFKGAKYTANELKSAYENIVKSTLNSFSNKKYADFPIELVFSKLYMEKGVSASKELINDTAQFFRLLSLKYIKLYDGVIELLDLLKSKNKKIYLLSNAQRIFTLYEMNFLNITKYFDDIFISSDYGVCKPDINFYNALIHKHNLILKDSIMIGNDPICDIEGAKNAGLDCLYIHSNLSPNKNSNIESTFSIMNMDISKISNLIIK